MKIARTSPALLALALGCGDTSTSAGTTQTDTGRAGRDAGDDDAPVRPRPDTGDDETTGEDAPERDSSVGADAIVDDGFVRPTRDVGTSDSNDDVSTPDDAGIDVPVVDDIVDEAPSTSRRLEGTAGCLAYRIDVTNTEFTYKGDDIAVSYFVQNICATPYPVRVAHNSDFFPIAIEKDGEPWVFLPDCPGTGAPFENTFETLEGLNRGWIWRAADHESRVARCGVAWDPDASYRIVGYGASEIDPLDGGAYSTITPMTPAIDIVLRP